MGTSRPRTNESNGGNSKKYNNTGTPRKMGLSKAPGRNRSNIRSAKRRTPLQKSKANNTR